MGKFLKKIKGVFFEETTITLGTGHTQKNQRVKNYCLAEQQDDDTVQVSFLGNEGQPTGIVVKMPYDEFLNKYTFEPDYKVKTKEEREHDKHIALAERSRNRNESFTAEMEYTSALKIDPESIKANFGIGTLYMEMGQTEKAKNVFKKLSQVDAIFEEDNKHIFNEFGIELRKANMTEEALDNYLKALEISPKDEHLYFNIARLYYDAKDWEYALLWIERCVKANPGFREAKQFAALIRKEKDEEQESRGRDEGDAPVFRRVTPKEAFLARKEKKEKEALEKRQRGEESEEDYEEEEGFDDEAGDADGEPAPEEKPTRASKIS
jgi:tetratricopeptide (TPR) repeat protein